MAFESLHRNTAPLERLRAVLGGFDVDLFEDRGDGFWPFHAVRHGTA